MATGNGFNVGEPLAYFLTWTTYGTWLPGDIRGWNRKGAFDGQTANDARHESATAALKESPFILTDDDRELIAKSIQGHCSIRDWELHAQNVRSNHVHVVVSADGVDPKNVVSQLKAWGTRELKTVHISRTRFWRQWN